MSRTRQKIKKFFKTKDATRATEEILEKFIMPFVKRQEEGVSVDDAIAAFFNTDKRVVLHAKALRKFRMPGQHMRIGGPPTKRFGIRIVPEGTLMTMVLDKKDGTIKIDLTLEGQDITFLLERFEWNYLKDRLEIYE